MQLFYNLSDPGMEDMLYEIESVRRFAGLRLTGPLPDETTILNFRHLLERHGLGRGLFEEINAHLAERGYRVRAGTIVDASIIAAPSSTKNREGARDPEMHQTRKGNEWHFGMKAHIGVDAETGLVHGVRATPANTHDLREAGALLHGGEEEVWADAGLPGDREVGGHGRPSGAVACGDETGAAAAPGAGRGAVAARAGQGFGAGKGGAPVPVCEAALRLPEGSLPRAGQEHGTDRTAPGASRTCSWRAAIRRRERPARETSAHAGRNEGIIGQNMPVLARFQPVIAPKTAGNRLPPSRTAPRRALLRASLEREREGVLVDAVESPGRRGRLEVGLRHDAVEPDGLHHGMRLQGRHLCRRELRGKSGERPAVHIVRLEAHRRG